MFNRSPLSNRNPLSNRSPLSKPEASESQKKALAIVSMALHASTDELTFSADLLMSACYGASRHGWTFEDLQDLMKAYMDSGNMDEIASYHDNPSGAH